MIEFYVGSTLLIVLAFIFLIWPYLSARVFRSNTLSGAGLREATNISLYRDHLEELEQSVETGSITTEQYQELKTELERNLLEDSQASSRDHQPKTGVKTLLLFLGLGIALLIAAAVLYTQLGAYESWQVKTVLDKRSALEQELLSTNDEIRQSQLRDRIVSTNQALVEQLQGHINKHPEDVQMRALLARTGLGLGDYALAIRQYQEILTLEPDVPQIMAELAQAIFLGADNRIVPMVDTLVDKVLALESDNPIALGLAGISAYQSQRYQQAIDYWQQAIVIQGSRSPNSIALQRGIDAAQQQLGTSTSASGVTTESSVAEAQQNTVKDLADTSALALPVSVTLGDNISVPQNAVVFIYARAWKGAKLPLAITRLSANQLPTMVTLDDSMAMAPGMNLSSAQQVEIVARISTSGSPVPQSGDWEATLGPITVSEIVKPISSAYVLTITQQIP